MGAAQLDRVGPGRCGSARAFPVQHNGVGRQAYRGVSAIGWALKCREGPVQGPQSEEALISLVDCESVLADLLARCQPNPHAPALGAVVHVSSTYCRAHLRHSLLPERRHEGRGAENCEQGTPIRV